MADRRILIVAFDALRPDMVTPALMPSLSRFADRGFRFQHARATFPSETRVNQAALVTGCYPRRHGIVGNRFVLPETEPGRLFDTGDESQIAEADRLLGGRLVEVPVLAEYLHAAGLSLAVVGSGTPGGTRMLHHKAESVGGFRLAFHRPDACVPAGAAEACRRAVGPIPPHAVPSLAWLDHAADCYLHFVEPELRPAVAILWLCEPDNSYHLHGPGSPESLAALRRADAAFGRILEWRAHQPAAERLQVITLSDHGQLTLAGERLELPRRLAEAGFSVGRAPGDGADLTPALSSAGGFYVNTGGPERVAAAAAWLRAQDWCGPVFARDDGGLNHAAVGLDHARAPEIALSLASDGRQNAHGIAGHTRHDCGYPVGGGMHGGLHPLELATWLAVAGDAFRAGGSTTPAGIVDVLPTVLRLLGLAVPPGLDGRVLDEALSAGPAGLPEARREIVRGRGWRLLRSHVAETFYLDGAVPA